MAGLDPAIHPDIRDTMDARVKPAHEESVQSESALARWGFFESPSRSTLLVEHDPSGRARGHAFPKTGIHPGSSPGQAFSGSCSKGRDAPAGTRANQTSHASLQPVCREHLSRA